MIDRHRIEPFSKLELLAKQVVEGFITGLHKSPFHGFSVEFAEHRIYNSGESTKHIDRKVFAKTDNIHPSYRLSEVIRGWRVGIPQIKKGGVVRLLLPSRYAYGPFAQPELGKAYGLTDGLPASAVLDFDITLYDIVN